VKICVGLLGTLQLQLKEQQVRKKELNKETQIFGFVELNGLLLHL